MNKSEMLKVIAYSQYLWPRLVSIPENPDLLEVMVKVWMDVLGDFDAEEVRAALLSMNGRQYPPSPGQLRIHLAESRGPGAPDWDEFWKWVREWAAKASLLTLHDAPKMVCKWPEFDDIVTPALLADWANSQLSERDLELVEQAHIRRRFEARLEGGGKKAMASAPAVVAFRDRMTEVAGSVDLSADRALEPPEDPPAPPEDPPEDPA